MNAPTSPTAPPAVPPTPRAAASIIVLRDTPRGVEVLMLHRAEKPGDQNSGATVFPGGLLDKSDRGHYERCDGLDDTQASKRLDLPSDGLHYWVAAVRECFEEAGILFAVDANGVMVDLHSFDAEALWSMRRELHANRIGMEQICERLGVRLAVGELAYYSHWITPVGRPKIFDTRFFIARAPAGQTAIADKTETVELLWLKPSEVLDESRGFKLLEVTARTLRHLAGFADVQSAIDAARAQTVVPVTRPRASHGPRGRRMIHADEPSFAEIGRLDPLGRGDVSPELIPGKPVWLSPRVLRVTAPGPGGNSYFIGAPGGSEWALLDPGPADAAHTQALREAAPGKVTRTFLTHTGKDSAVAVPPDQVLNDGDRIALGEGVTLRVIHAPGDGNRLCYLLEEEKLLFTGELVTQGTSAGPSNEEPTANVASLTRLVSEDLEWLAPGRGFLMDQPRKHVESLIAQRSSRQP